LKEFTETENGFQETYLRIGEEGQASAENKLAF